MTHGPGGGGSSAATSEQAWRRRRDFAVRDVLDSRLSVLGAAVVWGVQAADLQRWVDDATNAPGEP